MMPSSDSDFVPNILAERYASSEMRAIWSPTGKVQAEREFWIAVMRAQRELGLDIPAEAIAAYEVVRDQIDLNSITNRERVTRHDVKAKIEEFNELAGYEHIHKGMTSRDLSENVEQLQIFRAMSLVRDRSVAVLAKMADRAMEFAAIPLTARTHNVAAQITTLGRRFAMFGEELADALKGLQHLIETYPARGIKGAVGTQMDQLQLFDLQSDKVAALEESLVRHLGLPGSLIATGQVYPRSLDLRVVSALAAIGSGLSSFAQTLRLMAGQELASEGFAEGQTGSSAMPHKMNSRSCERINGFMTLIRGYLTMAGGLAGDQWNEGDVSCSVVRRVLLPDSFFAIDGMMETMLTILNQLEIFPEMLETEAKRNLPFLLTTTVLMEAIKSGAGREAAHEAIKEHAIQTIRDLRSGACAQNNLLFRLANDNRIGLDLPQLEHLLTEAMSKNGSAIAQIGQFCELAEAWKLRFPDAATYEPHSIL